MQAMRAVHARPSPNSKAPPAHSHAKSKLEVSGTHSKSTYIANRPQWAATTRYSHRRSAPSPAACAVSASTGRTSGSVRVENGCYKQQRVVIGTSPTLNKAEKCRLNKPREHTKQPRPGQIRTLLRSFRSEWSCCSFEWQT
jgi:hypothetical protein